MTLAEVYQFAELIQLYRVFPDLLQQRLPSEKIPSVHDGGVEGVPSLISSPYDDQQFGAEHQLGSNENLRDDWITGLALTTLNLLESLPLASKTQSLTPFLLVASSSELRLPRLMGQESDEEDYSAPSRHADVLRMRKFVEKRLKFYLRLLLLKLIHVFLELVNTIWEKIDQGEENVSWMDVMIDNGWETTMG